MNINSSNQHFIKALQIPKNKEKSDPMFWVQERK